MSDVSKHSACRLVPLEKAQALVEGAIRGNAVATWRDAADMAENYAAEVEAGSFPAADGPETCRRLAELYRTVADRLDSPNGFGA